jgi:hypothetical protein
VTLSSDGREFDSSNKARRNTSPVELTTACEAFPFLMAALADLHEALDRVASFDGYPLSNGAMIGDPEIPREQYCLYKLPCRRR